MKRRLLVPDDVKHYRWLLQLDSLFEPPPLPRGFTYEAQIDRTLEMIWSHRMTDVLGIDLDRFRKITKVSVVQQKRDLLDVALTCGPILSSRTFLSAMDALLLAENTGHQPIDVRPPAHRIKPVRIQTSGDIEIWCGPAAAIPGDICLVLADIDLSSGRVATASETSHRAHALAGPHLRSDCSLVKGFFEADFLPGSVAITRGYFSMARFIAHVVPPRIDDGIWKHTLVQLRQCYAGLWELANRQAAKRVAVQLIPLGRDIRSVEQARSTLLEQVQLFLASRAHPVTICLATHTFRESLLLAAELDRQRLAGRLRRTEGLRPAGIDGARFSPGTFGVRKADGLTDSASASRSSNATVGFSRPRSSRLM